jgi:hypothetical protein
MAEGTILIPALALIVTLLTAVPGAPLAAERAATGIDVTLAELYGLQSFGRAGSYPEGRSGLSAATTACNTGSSDVPWNAPMAETHPFLGFAMYRIKDGILEMIGRSWIKHAYFALSQDVCELGCAPSDGTHLGVGCSDTYSAVHNASRYDLGPRAEVDPFAAEWEACGSFFDAEPVDCLRDYFGSEPDGASHRLEVHDSDLGLLNADGSKARYLYEAVYYVAGDELPESNAGWRECSTEWSGSSWIFPSESPELAAHPGPVILTWGDLVDTETVAPGDGEVTLATQVTELPGGGWHYEYALCNRRSARGIRAFEIPVGSAGVSNAGFHDVGTDPGDDWSVSHEGGAVVWSTAEHASDPDAPALGYQTTFNFRFDADRGPVPALARGSLFEPGAGGFFFLETRAPDPGATAVASGPAGGPLSFSLWPNPVTGAATLRFSLPRPDRARISLHDVSGRLVRVLLDAELPAGPSTVRWAPVGAGGRAQAAGVYFLVLESGGARRALKTALVP